MAARDIMPFKSPLGGTYETRWGSMTASEVFEVGEPIGIVAAGTLTEPGDDGGEVLVGDFQNGAGGIACFGPGDGTSLDPKTGVAFAALADISYWPFGDGTQFITRNFYDDTAAAVVVPAQTDVGEHYQMLYSATVGFTSSAGWGLNQTAALAGVDLVSLVVDVLDAQKIPIRISGNAGVYVVFEVDKPTLAAA